MIATVAVPTAQSILRAGVNDLPFDLAHVAVFVYAGSLAISIVLLFGCLALIYSRVPNRRVPWRAVWPGALGATLAIAVVDYAFPLYLTNISTIAQFGTTIVFILIVLGWFYVLAIIILGGASGQRDAAALSRTPAAGHGVSVRSRGDRDRHATARRQADRPGAARAGSQQAVHALGRPSVLDLRRLPGRGDRDRRRPPRAVGRVRRRGLGEGDALARACAR